VTWGLLKFTKEVAMMDGGEIIALHACHAKAIATRRAFHFPQPVSAYQKRKFNLDCHSMAPIKRSRVEKARQFLTGGAVFREDSDDELGYEDHPWEWIYDHSGVDDAPKENATPRKRKAAPASLGQRIVGARMGKFRCKVGDAVLLKAEGNQAWVGIICDFHEDVEDDEKMAKFLWFSSEKEIRNKNKKRTDFLPASRVYYLFTTMD
jgi:hypothetical protein